MLDAPAPASCSPKTTNALEWTSEILRNKLQAQNFHWFQFLAGFPISLEHIYRHILNPAIPFLRVGFTMPFYVRTQARCPKANVLMTP